MGRFNTFVKLLEVKNSKTMATLLNYTALVEV